MLFKHIGCKSLHEFIVVISVVILISRAPRRSLFRTSRTRTTRFLVGITEHEEFVVFAPFRHCVIHTCFYKRQRSHCATRVFQNAARITNIASVRIENTAIICKNIRFVQTNRLVRNFAFHQRFNVLFNVAANRRIYRVGRGIFTPMPSIRCIAELNHLRPIGNRISHCINTQRCIRQRVMRGSDKAIREPIHTDLGCFNRRKRTAFAVNGLIVTAARSVINTIHRFARKLMHETQSGIIFYRINVRHRTRLPRIITAVSKLRLFFNNT